MAVSPAAVQQRRQPRRAGIPWAKSTPHVSTLLRDKNRSPSTETVPAMDPTCLRCLHHCISEFSTETEPESVITVTSTEQPSPQVRDPPSPPPQKWRCLHASLKSAIRGASLSIRKGSRSELIYPTLELHMHISTELHPRSMHDAPPARTAVRMHATLIFPESQSESATKAATVEPSLITKIRP